MKTIGIALVASLAASAGWVGLATIRSTGRPTSSAARRGSGSALPSEKRHSMARFCPSTQPRSRRPWRNVRNPGVGCVLVEPWDSTPNRRIFGWARAARGRQIEAAAAPPRKPRNSRRLVCRERSIVRGDRGRVVIAQPPSRPEARRRLGYQTASELGAPVASSIPVQLPGHEPASARMGYEDGHALFLRYRRVEGPLGRGGAASGVVLFGK